MLANGPHDLSASPHERLRELTGYLDEADVATWCGELLSAPVAYEDPGSPSLTWLGGHHAAELLARGALGSGVHDYWPRVWAARALLYVWNPGVASTVVAALQDDHWRVREMAAKVVRKREIGEAADALITLTDDETARVRTAAVRAIDALHSAERPGEGSDREVLDR
jgi:hypothetical protein